MKRRAASHASSTGKNRPDAACLSPPWEEHGMRLKTVCLIFSSVLLLSAVLLAGGCAIIRPQGYRSFVTQTPAPGNSYLVIGFMGGVEAWDADKHQVRKLALKLRSLDLPNVDVETVENRQEKLALELIPNALDRNGDGKLDEEERASARVILYGHSLGGGSVVKLASELKEIGVPVLLTIQVDSVGRKDRVIPSNVARAINFYQHDGPFIRGRSEIVAEDSQKTTILANYKYDYKNKKVDDSALIWLARILEGAHAKLEFDPDVWAKVSQLIVHEIEEPSTRTPESQKSESLIGQSP
jgi:hypothetical protein